MPHKVIKAGSIARLLKHEMQIAREVVQQKGACTLVVASHELEDARKLLASYECPLGVQVQTFDHWLAGAWELCSDGRKLLTAAQRHVILRPLLQELTGLECSSAYVDILARFVKDYVSLGCPDAVDEQSEALTQVARAYLQNCSAKNLVEPASIFEQAAQAVAGQALIFEEPDLSHAYLRSAFEHLSAYADVYELQLCIAAEDHDELGCERDHLAAQLFTGKGNLEPTGFFVAAECFGAHAEPALVAQLIEGEVEKGLSYSDIAVVLPSVADGIVRISDELALRHIPFECEYAVKVRDTPFGIAFKHLENLVGTEDAGYLNDAAFIASPYSGLSDEDARAYECVWRGLGGATKDERLDMLHKGLKTKSGSKIWEAKLERVNALLAAETAAERVKLMFENGRKAGLGHEQLLADAAVAQAILEHLDLCEQLGAEWSYLDIRELAVPTTLAAGDECAVHICEPGAQGRRQCIIMGRLEQKAYSMASDPQPFDAILASLGAPVEDDTAASRRLELLDVLQSAQQHFIAYRRCHDIEGNECCQSALWDELMTVYRSEADEAAGRPVHEVPLALVQSGCMVRKSEEQIFREADEAAVCKELKRGKLGTDGALQLLMPDFDAYKETFSPTALEDYYRCPYRWFISRRVGANPIDKQFDQIAKGNLAHAAFDRVYAQLKEAGVERVTPDNLQSALEVASEAFTWQRDHEIERGRLRLMTNRDKRECESVRTQVLDLIERDARFLPGFVPTYSEFKLEAPDGSPLEYAGVKVRGRVDRIDVNEQGQAVIIDYKLSGLASGYGFDVSDGFPTRIQTDIYATLVERCFALQGADIEVVGSVYRSYAKNSLRGVYSSVVEWGPDEKARPDNDAIPGKNCGLSYRDYLTRLEEVVAQHMERLKAGEIAPHPICKDACTYCLAESFCAQRRG